jgi:hypothetical protein
MPEDKDKSVEELKALVKIPGSLRVITARHACDPKYATGPQYKPKTDEELAACEAFEFPQTDWRHQVIHEVVSLEEPDHNGRMKAHTAEGDVCVGRPNELLKRLREAREV